MPNPRNEFLEDVFLFCPGNNATVVSCPEMLGESPDTYNLPSKVHPGMTGWVDLALELIQDKFQLVSLFFCCFLTLC